MQSSELQGLAEHTLLSTAGELGVKCQRNAVLFSRLYYSFKAKGKKNNNHEISLEICEQKVKFRTYYFFLDRTKEFDLVSTTTTVTFH